MECKQCNKSFTRTGYRQMYCSSKCRRNYERIKTDKLKPKFECVTCGRVTIKKTADQYACSQKCRERFYSKIRKRLFTKTNKQAVIDFINKNIDTDKTPEVDDKLQYIE